MLGLTALVAYLPKPASPPGPVTIGNSRSTVMTAVQHDAADLLSGGPPAVRSKADLERENENLRQLCEVARVLATAREPETALTDMMERALGALDADMACLLVRAEDPGQWRTRAWTSRSATGGEVTVSRTIVQRALDDGVAILSRNPRADDRFDPSRSIVAQRITSALCCPVKVRDEPVGVLFADRRNRRAAFADTDLRLAAASANLLSLFLEKEKHEAESREKQRLAVIGEVVAGLAHYAKNILMGLRFSLAALRRQFARKQLDDAERSLTSIALSAQQISDLVLDMLSYAKERQPVREPLELAPLIEQAADVYRPLMDERKVAFELDAAPDTPRVLAEAQAVQRVFLNLVVNAIDAVGSVEEGRPKRIRAIVAPVEANGHVRVRFADTGCGIPEDKLGDIFRVFFSTKGSGGTGLGLAVVRKIIEEHGGTIEVTSHEGQGTEFLLTFPAAAAEAAP